MSKHVLIYPIPWDLTTSNRAGTASAPLEIKKAMHQLDSSHPFVKTPVDITFLPENKRILDMQQQYSAVSRDIINTQHIHGTLTTEQKNYLNEINLACVKMHAEVFNDCNNRTDPILLCGGEHGVGVGFIDTIPEDSFGILQIDAHMDCRISYLGYTASHASVITHYSSCHQVSSITQVGIRDFDQSEKKFQDQSQTDFYVFYDYEMHKKIFHGTTWHDICTSIIQTLPNNVFLSIDVDGLSPSNSPSTGTPVSGGISYNQWVYLMELVFRNRTIVGAELVEVGCHDHSPLDVLLGARMIHVLSGMLVGD